MQYNDTRLKYNMQQTFAAIYPFDTRILLTILFSHSITL